MDSLAKHLADAKQQGANTIPIATDGVSMDGDIAKLDEICRLAARRLSWLTTRTPRDFRLPRGSIEHCGVMGKVDIINSTLESATARAADFSGPYEIVDLLRRKSALFIQQFSAADAGMRFNTCNDMLPKAPLRINSRKTQLFSRKHD